MLTFSFWSIIWSFFENVCNWVKLFFVNRVAVRIEWSIYGWFYIWCQNHDVTDSDAETLTILTELFLEKAAQWVEVIHAINCIDVLRSFAATSSFSCGTMSRPVIVPASKSTSKDSGGPVLKMKGLWHPFALGESGCLPVPNDIILGGNEDGHHPRTLLLTGPNMGGKSTLLRATCLAVIMAQVLCLLHYTVCLSLT